MGLRSIWFPEIEPIVYKWSAMEADQMTGHALYEHMAACSDQSDSYLEAAVHYFALHTNEELRTRLQAAAVGTRAYPEFQHIKFKHQLTTVLPHEKLKFINPGGAINMTVDQNINAGRDVSVGGDLAVEKNTSVCQISHQI